MMGNDYVKSLTRFSKSVTSELENKLTGQINLNLRPVVDPLGDEYAGLIANLRQHGTLAANQATYLLQQAGYLPDDLPAGKAVPGTTNTTSKGGDTNDQD